MKSQVYKIDNFMNLLPSNLSEKYHNARKLMFMAEKAMRQLGPAQIGIFEDWQWPEPVHCEINAWQHLLNIVYREAVKRGTSTKFIDILSASTDQGTVTEKAMGFLFLMMMDQSWHDSNARVSSPKLQGAWFWVGIFSFCGEGTL